MTGNFQDTQAFREFPKFLGFWETSQISSHLRNFQNLKNIPPSNIYRNLGNFPNACLKKNVNVVVSCVDSSTRLATLEFISATNLYNVNLH